MESVSRSPKTRRDYLMLDNGLCFDLFVATLIASVSVCACDHVVYPCDHCEIQCGKFTNSEIGTCTVYGSVLRPK